MPTAPPPISPLGRPGEDGVWRALRLDETAKHEGRPALFLDRDGIVNEDTGYVHRVEDLRLLPGASALIRAANGLGLAVIVVTNQSGIGRGYFSWADFTAFQTEIERRLTAEDAWLDAVLACPFHRDAEPPFNVDEHPARKPRPGMLLAAAAALGIALEQSWIVGDRASDLQAGAGAGLAGGVMVGDRPVSDLPAGFAVGKAPATADVAAQIPLLNA